MIATRDRGNSHGTLRPIIRLHDYLPLWRKETMYFLNNHCIKQRLISFQFLRSHDFVCRGSSPCSISIHREEQLLSRFLSESSTAYPRMLRQWPLVLSYRETSPFRENIVLMNKARQQNATRDRIDSRNVQIDCSSKVIHEDPQRRTGYCRRVIYSIVRRSSY